jgi:hypothetical protein
MGCTYDDTNAQPCTCLRTQQVCSLPGYDPVAIKNGVSDCRPLGGDCADPPTYLAGIAIEKAICRPAPTPAGTPLPTATPTPAPSATPTPTASPAPQTLKLCNFNGVPTSLYTTPCSASDDATNFEPALVLGSCFNGIVCPNSGKFCISIQPGAPYDASVFRCE